MNDSRMPGIAAAARAQFRLLANNRYAAASIGLPIFGLLMTRAFGDTTIDQPWMQAPIMSRAHVVIVLIGLACATLAWANEGPERRKYHWSMPVRRETHDVVRIVAGAVWMLIGITIFCVAAYFAEAKVMRTQWLSRAPWFWFSLFATPLLVFLLATIASLLNSRPLMWVLLFVISLLFMSTNPFREYLPVVGDLVEDVFGSRTSYGFTTAMRGGEATAPWNSAAERQRVFKAVGGKLTMGRTKVVATATNMDFELRQLTQPPASLSMWLCSLAVWYAVALIGLAAALTRRPNV